MKNLEKTLDIFLKLTKSHTGMQPTFKINYKENTVDLVDAPSSFLKLVYSNSQVCAHLHKGILSISYFE